MEIYSSRFRPIKLIKQMKIVMRILLAVYLLSNSDIRDRRVYPSYVDGKSANDMARIRLVDSSMNSIQPACIPAKHDDILR